MIEDDYVRQETEKAAAALRDADAAVSQIHDAMAKLLAVDFPILAGKMIQAGMPMSQALRLRHDAERDLRQLQTDLRNIGTSVDLLTADFRHISEDFEQVVTERKRAGVR